MLGPFTHVGETTPRAQNAGEQGEREAFWLLVFRAPAFWSDGAGIFLGIRLTGV